MTNIIDKLKNNSFFDNKRNCFLFPLISLFLCYIFSILKRGKPDPGGYYLIHYLYNYKHGYVPRGLLGEILSWFFDKISDNLISEVSNLFSVLLVLAVSVLCGRSLYKARENVFKLNAILIIMFICFVMPTTFNIYFEAINLDKILWFLTIVAVCFSETELGVWLVPFLCVAATMVNPMYLFGSMIFIAIILLQKFNDSGFSLKNGLICFLSYASMLFLGIYAPISEKKLGFETVKEVVDYYFSRYTGTLSNDTYSSFLTEWMFDYVQPIDEVIKSAFNFYFIGWQNGQKFVLYLIFVAIPFYFLLGIIWVNAIKNETKHFQKFIYFLCLISPIVIIPPIIISWELPRYFSDNFITQLCLIGYFVLAEKHGLTISVKNVLSYIMRNKVILMVMIYYFIMMAVL